MFPYETVKSIHDQRMRQFMIEAERTHLLRQLRKDRQVENGLFEHMRLRLREEFQAVGAALKPKRLAG